MIKQDSLSTQVSEGRHFEKRIALALRRILRLLHIVFSLALLTTVGMTLIIFMSDIYHIIIVGENLTTGTIHALGTLLILWTLAELLSSEIKHLQGEKINVTIFIEVAIAALVRKILIITSEGASLEVGSIYLGSLMVLGVVYWLLQPRHR